VGTPSCPTQKLSRTRGRRSCRLPSQLCPVSSAQRCAPCRMSFKRSRAGQDASAKSGSADP
jgi:hypothetical protein